MEYSPLTGSENNKVVIFLLLLLPLILSGAGILPALVISFGIYMVKKYEDFSYFESVAKFVKVYAYIFVLIFLGFVVRLVYESYFLRAGLAVLLSLSPIIYLILFDKFFYKPLKKHARWVEVNSIFSTKEKKSNNKSRGALLIDGKEDQVPNTNNLSVADELIKWVKLKEDGHITEKEFDAARTKLLNQS